MSQSTSTSTSGNVSFGDPKQSNVLLWIIGALAVVAVLWIFKGK